MSNKFRLRTAGRSESGREVFPSMTYQSAVADVRRPRPNVGAETDYRELIRLGSLAASSHNTQPWKFTAGGGSIRILPDFSRRCPVVDPHDAHLFKSLGCAAENVVHAAAAQGLRADVEFDDNDRVVVVQLTADPTCGETALARAIPLRQCTKARYDGRALDSEGTRHTRAGRHRRRCPTHPVDRRRAEKDGDGVRQSGQPGPTVRSRLADGTVLVDPIERSRVPRDRRRPLGADLRSALGADVARQVDPSPAGQTEVPDQDRCGEHPVIGGSCRLRHRG